MTENSVQSELDRVARQCFAARLRLVNRYVTNLYDEALRPLGLKVSQMNILVTTRIPINYLRFQVFFTRLFLGSVDHPQVSAGRSIQRSG